MNRRNSGSWLALFAVCVVTGLFWYLRSTMTGQRLTDRLRATATIFRHQPAKATNSPGAIPFDAAGFDDFRDRLSASNDKETNRRTLSELRRLLDALPREAASRAIQSFLVTGKDAATKLDVTIKPGGNLGDASSLRVFLLDYLGQIDRPAAGMIALRILSTYTTPDEWAISLRNYAWANPDKASQIFLETKARELLANQEWLKDPTAGFLEAFDTVVYAHGITLTPELAALLRDKENRAAAHAAYLTLDRLTITEPAVMLEKFVEQPELMQGREQTRANFVARADLRQPDQRALVEKYLLDPGRSPEEVATFAALYPNANYMISDNLLSKVETPGAIDLPANDREALRIVEQWQKDPRFERIKPVINRMRERLQSFVDQAGSNDR
jgi:hypothetical protein